MAQLLVRDPTRGYLDCNLWVPKAHVNVEGVKRALTFQTFDQTNVTFYTLYKETESHLVVPREFWDPKDFPFPVVDCRPDRYPEVDVQSRIRLDHEVRDGQLIPNGHTIQQEAMAALLRARGGILQLACGRGKTCVALDLIAREKVPTLIVLDTNQLMKQWREQIDTWLIVPDGIGLIQGDVFDWQKPIVLATYHTLGARAADMPEEVRRWFGRIIWDEAHHVAAPKFSRSADLFYGKRTGLTATPKRDDGTDVVYSFHMGPVLYKNLKQDLKPRIYFIWTGLSLDQNDPAVAAAIRDCNGELHIGKVASHFGRWRPRLEKILDQVRAAVAQDRKIIVLSKSVDELVNLFALWNQEQGLYTDVPFPTPQEVGETFPPLELEAKEAAGLQKEYGKICGMLAQSPPPKNASVLEDRKKAITSMLAGYEVFKKCEALWNKRRNAYLKELLKKPSSAGLMIYKVGADDAHAMLRSRQVTFAIMKYGREGLDEKSLDTIIVCEPISKKGSLQQLMGRVLRYKEGKKDPVVVFLEDDIGPFIGMCKKLRGFLREWSPDEGGPFDFEMLGYPNTKSAKKDNTWNRTDTRPPTLRRPAA